MPSLVDHLIQLSDILTISTTSAVASWDLAFLKRALFHASSVEVDLLYYPEDETESAYREVVERAKSQKRCPPQPYAEFTMAYRELCRRLLRNRYLKKELYAVLLNEYRFQIDGLMDIKENISQARCITTERNCDVQACGKTAAVSDLLADIENTFREEIAQLPHNPADSRVVIAAIKYKHQFELLSTTIERRAAARLLLKDFCPLFANDKADTFTIKELKKELNIIASHSDGMMEIIVHAALLSAQASTENIPNELYAIIQEWILAVAMNERNSSVLKSQLWTVHPWLLAQLSLFLPAFFNIYTQHLIQFIRQLQAQGSISTARLPDNEAEQNSTINRMLECWQALIYQSDFLNEKVTEMLAGEWTRCNSQSVPGMTVMNTHVWKEFFARLGI